MYGGCWVVLESQGLLLQPIHRFKQSPGLTLSQRTSTSQQLIQRAKIGTTFRITIIRGNSCQLKNLQEHAFFCRTYFAERWDVKRCMTWILLPRNITCVSSHVFTFILHSCQLCSVLLCMVGRQKKTARNARVDHSQKVFTQQYTKKNCQVELPANYHAPPIVSPHWSCHGASADR